MQCFDLDDCHHVYEQSVRDIALNVRKFILCYVTETVMSNSHSLYDILYYYESS